MLNQCLIRNVSTDGAPKSYYNQFNKGRTERQRGGESKRRRAGKREGEGYREFPNKGPVTKYLIDH